jgi:hypothetical protein
MLDILRQCQSPQKVRQVVRQGEQLQACLIVLERAAGELRPYHGVLAFLDPLLRRAATIVKLDHILRVLIQIGHNEADTWEQFACVSFDLGHDAPCPLSRFRLILEAVVENVVRCQVNPSSVHLQILPPGTKPENTVDRLLETKRQQPDVWAHIGAVNQVCVPTLMAGKSPRRYRYADNKSSRA